jgi:hypothetical protein
MHLQNKCRQISYVHVTLKMAEKPKLTLIIQSILLNA